MGGSIICLIIGLAWTAGTLLLGIELGSATYRQYQSRNFPQAPGKILESKVEERHGGKKTSYSPLVRYEYRIGDKTYQSSNIRFGTKVSMKGPAQEEVRRYPVGKELTVYYDPENPESATLDTSLRGSDFFGLIFITPFICVGLGLIAGGFLSMRARLQSSETGGAQVLTSAGGRIQVRLPEGHPCFYALGATGVLAFICVFAVGFPTAMNPSLSLVILSWLACVTAGAVIFLREYSRLKLGYYDLVIDSGAAMVALPRIYGLRTPKTVGFREIKEIRVKEHVSRGSKGQTHRTYDVNLRLADGAEHKIASHTQSSRAAALAGWLRGKLGI